MKIRLLILFVSLVFASTAFANVVEVRSGEHDTFSRIVLRIPAETQWVLKKTGTDVELLVKLPSIRFDIQQVFDRIPKTRLHQISQEKLGEPLQMKLGCDCGVTGFVQSNTLLVIDIQDSEIPAKKPAPALSATQLLSFGKLDAINLHDLALPNDLQPENELSTVESNQVESRKNSTANSRPFGAQSGDVNVSELRLLSQIDRAAAHGLLLRNIHPYGGNGDPREIDLNRFRTHQPNISSESQRHVGMPIIIDSAGLDISDIHEIGMGDENRNSCLPPELVALSDWGSTLSYGAQIGSRRSRLFEEFDNINQQSLIALARNLVFFGFGAEAQNTLKLLAVQDLSSQVLNAIAELLDNGIVLTRNPFLNQLNCDSDVALWAYLADSDPTNSKHPNINAVLTAFGRLPDQLRVLLGSVLINKLSQSQDLQSADIVSRTASRVSIGSDPALDLARANMDLQHKGTKFAADKISLIALSGSELSPQALIDLVDAQTLADATISPDMPDLIAAYKAEYRNSDLSEDLNRVHILSLALAGRFSEAFFNYYEKKMETSLRSDERTLSQTMTLLTKRANNITFLRHSLMDIERNKSSFPASLQNLIAARLIELGFLSQASSLLTRRKGPENSGRSVMNAQVAISENLPHRALVELLGSNDSSAQNLRYEAFLDIGDYENAGLSREAFGSDAGRAFWHAENWEAVGRQGESRFTAAADFSKALRNLEQKSEIQDTLAYGQALVARSVSTRSDISSLLNLVGQGL
jgi:hypothetical protein